MVEPGAGAASTHRRARSGSGGHPAFMGCMGCLPDRWPPACHAARPLFLEQRTFACALLGCLLVIPPRLFGHFAAESCTCPICFRRTRRNGYCENCAVFRVGYCHVEYRRCDQDSLKATIHACNCVFVSPCFMPIRELARWSAVSSLAANRYGDHAQCQLKLLCLCCGCLPYERMPVCLQPATHPASSACFCPHLARTSHETCGACASYLASLMTPVIAVLHAYAWGFPNPGLAQNWTSSSTVSSTRG